MVFTVTVFNTSATMQSHDHESFAESSAKLKEIVDKSGPVPLWDVCKDLGWTISKGKTVSKKMAEKSEIFITKKHRNGRTIRVLSSSPIPDQSMIDSWKTEESSSASAQIEVQDAIINALIDLTMMDVKDYLEKYFDFSPIPEDVLMKMRIGTALVDIAARKIGYSKGVVDERLKSMLLRR